MTNTFHKQSFLIRTATLAACIILSSVLAAQAPTYLPLEVGNTWLYRPAPANNAHGNRDPQSFSVHGKQTVGGREYFQVTWFGREVLLRIEPADGSVAVYDQKSNSDLLWVSLGMPVGGTFPTQINPCPTTGLIAARDATVVTPAGSFNGGIQVKYQGNCVDVGVTQQIYAPNVGLVVSEETSFGGAIKYELVYYHVGSTTGGSQEVSFTAALDSPQYMAGATLQARLTLRNSGPNPIQLQFPSGQSFDLKILDEKGNVVYLWSKGRVFTLIVRNESFGPGEKTYGLSAPLTGLAPGRYTAEAYLTTNPLMYLADVSFEITPAQNAAAERNLLQAVVKEAHSRVSHY